LRGEPDSPHRRARGRRRRRHLRARRIRSSPRARAELRAAELSAGVDRDADPRIGGRGSQAGAFGVEIDAQAPSSPPGTIVLARIPDAVGRGLGAEMTYYETPAGAKVFAAGAFSLASAATARPVDTLLQNLWARLSQP
jgi:hypothetical protein